MASYKTTYAIPEKKPTLFRPIESNDFLIGTRSIIAIKLTEKPIRKNNAIGVGAR
jgi:hypothetical protein